MTAPIRSIDAAIGPPDVRPNGRAGLSVAAVISVLLIAGCAGAPSKQAEDLGGPPDAVPKVEPKAKYGNMESYVVFGKRYYPKASSRNHVERGIASWYGPKFHGRKTSSGEIYDMHQMTAAHKTLPLPTYARVTNLENGRSAVVRINDRGPFVGDRVIDLSLAAAQKLDVVQNGTARVEVVSIDPRDHGGKVPKLHRVAAPAPVPDNSPKVAAAASSHRDPFSGLRASSPSPVEPPPARTAAVAPVERWAGPGAGTLDAASGTSASGTALASSSLPSDSTADAAISFDEPTASSAGGADGSAERLAANAGGAGTANGTGPPARAEAALAAVPAVASGASAPVYLQVGAFGTRDNAEQLRRQVSGLLRDPAVQVSEPGAAVADGGPALYRVRIGPVASRADADSLSRKLGTLGIDRPILVAAD